MLTRDDHQSGTDRIAEVATRLELPDDAIVLNVQGDEPELDPQSLDLLVGRLADAPACGCATLACPFPAGADPDDPNAVKVACDPAGRALYFSRSRIPHPREPQDPQAVQPLPGFGRRPWPRCNAQPVALGRPARTRARSGIFRSIWREVFPGSDWKRTGPG